MAPAPTPVEIGQDETLTGEAVALDVQPIGFFLRALGTLIDVVAAIGVLVLVFWGLSWLFGGGILPSSTVSIAAITVLVVVWVVLPTTVETLTRGRSLGKLVVGARIVRTDGGAAGFRHAFIRALTGVLEIWLTLGVVAAIVGAFTPRAQRLGDLLAGTASERIRTRTPATVVTAAPPPLAEWAAIADVARLPTRLAFRIRQFTLHADELEPSARHRAAAELAAEAAPFVAPVPEVDPETFVRGIAAVRRSREHTALLAENQRVAALVGADRARRR